MDLRAPVRRLVGRLLPREREERHEADGGRRHPRCRPGTRPGLQRPRRDDLVPIPAKAEQEDTLRACAEAWPAIGDAVRNAMHGSRPRLRRTSGSAGSGENIIAEQRKRQ